MTTCDSTKRLSDFCLAQRRRDAEKRICRFLSASLRLCAILLASQTASAEWPFARGGFESTGACDIDLGDEPQVLWTYEAGKTSLEATPVVAAGVAYFGDFDGTIHAVRVADGSLVWKKTFEKSGFVSPAALGGEALVAPDMNGLVRSLAIADGAERWTFDSKSEAYGGPMVHQAPSGESLVLLPTEGGTLFALDAATGEERWSFAIEAPLRCTPTVVAGCALLAGCDGKLHTVDITTGKSIGAVEIGDPTGNTAAVLDGVAYFGTEGGSFQAVDASDPAKPTVKWTHRDPKNGQGIRTAAAVTANAVVYANQAKLVAALAPQTGKPLWQHRTRAQVEASPLVVAGGRFLIATTRGQLLLLDGKTGDPVWQEDLGGSFTAPPAASDGLVLLANTDGVLYAVGKKE